MPITTKEERRARYGHALWISKNEAASINDESIWKVDQKIKRGEYISRKEDSGTIRIWRASVEKTPNQSSKFSTPTKPAA